MGRVVVVCSEIYGKVCGKICDKNKNHWHSSFEKKEAINGGGGGRVKKNTTTKTLGHLILEQGGQCTLLVEQRIY